MNTYNRLMKEYRQYQTSTDEAPTDWGQFLVDRIDALMRDIGTLTTQLSMYQKNSKSPASPPIP